ncbi:MULTISPECIES: dual specificity protein phosphatase family protein [unclassified Pseudoalteromonas]|uniref:phosphatase domain-containing protein n=1 Tax=unclassified Pseudoalteromonas TaxID=194690 RepID=UPI0015FC4660|nr:MULTISPECIES: dual specificity protein phosphatase family protein [unclassified Pseudoalteromonas]MBB1355871.1 dual specificity protein phosphatase family protein [Pseudoalteromonas sp. SR45-5]MBB1456350.1 dual specificity protein phosphatase family protein [Pseudoalteromonas sp. SG43-5]
MSAHPYNVLSLNNGANIIFTPCPGTKTQNLADSITTLKAAGTHMLLSLMPQKELEKNNVQTINSECSKHDITWFHLPINDDEAPKQPFTSSWNTHKTDILQAIQHKQTIAIHCKGGTGRTGLVAALILNSAGYTKEEVYSLVQGIRPKALTIELQKEYFENFEV